MKLRVKTALVSIVCAASALSAPAALAWDSDDGCGGSLHPCSTAEWDPATKVSDGAPAGYHWSGIAESYLNCGTDAIAKVRLEGDVVYVLDACADGRSAVGYW